jgi:hypothetical protein
MRHKDGRVAAVRIGYHFDMPAVAAVLGGW